MKVAQIKMKIDDFGIFVHLICSINTYWSLYVLFIFKQIKNFFRQAIVCECLFQNEIFSCQTSIF